MQIIPLCEHNRTTVLIENETGRKILWCQYCGAIKIKKGWQNPDIFDSK